MAAKKNETKEVVAAQPVSVAHGLAIAALVVGIVGFISGWVPFWGFVVGVAAVVLGIIALRKKAVAADKGLAIAGLVTGAVGALWSGVVTIFFIFALIVGIAGSGAAKAAFDAAANSANQAAHLSTKDIPASRQASGTLVTLGAGTFMVGHDIQSGVYDVTAAAGESGNFTVDGNDSYNEILGQSDGFGVSKVRVSLQEGDKVQLENLNHVTFTPVTTAFVKEYKATSLYAGSFIVGEDIAAGRYIVTPGDGQSGNFSVSGEDSYNEILGGDYGVANVTVTLSTGDDISISGLDQVNFAIVQ